MGGAHVVVKNVATAIENKVDTNNDGQYVVLFLYPGKYNVTVEKDGFRRISQSDITLETSKQTGLDFQLELGSVAASLEVKATAEALETENATRGAAINSKLLLDLPNNGRSTYSTILGTMGVTRAGKDWGSFGNAGLGSASGISINGGIAKENETVLDGVADTLPSRDVAFQPPIESIVETRVQTSSYDASYGRFGGGVVAITTKGGTNQLHGVLFETNRNAALAARTWASNLNNTPKSKNNANQFGFEVDGPIYIPKVVDGRNKLFFMLSMDSRRTIQPGGNTAFLPTEAQRNGDYSAIPRTIYDPKSTTLINGQYVRTPFVGNRIPAERINPVAKQVLGYVPLPNLAGAAGFGARNFLGDVGSSSSYDQFLGRVDWRLNDKNALSFTYGQLPYAEVDEVLFGADSPADVSRENPLARGFHRYTFDWAHTINASAIFNFRFGYTKYTEVNQQPAAIGFNPEDLGIDPALVSQFSRLQFPRFEMGGYSGIGSPNPYQRGARDTMSWQANHNQLIGRHQLKAGAEFRVYNNNLLQPGLSSGLYQFSRAFTQANPLAADAASGDEFASFLLGYPSGGRVDRNIDPAYRGTYLAFFAQDDFKITPWLTINVGLRWDYESPFAERYNRMVRGFAFDKPSPLAAQLPDLNLMGGLLYAGDNGSDRLAFDPDRNNFQPRIGFAARLRPWLVMRGGWGIYYLGQAANQPSTGFSSQSPINSSADGGLTPRVSLNNAIPEGLTPPLGSSRGLSTNLGQSISFGYLNRIMPSSQQASLGFQFNMPLGFTGEAGYSMNLTRKYPVSVDLNSIPKDQLGRASTYYTEQVTNPFSGLLPANPAMNGNTIPRRNLLVRFPQYTSVTMTDIPIGRQDYHALQTRLTRRYANGVTFDISYVWSKILEQRSFLNPQDFNLPSAGDSKLEKRLGEYDIPHKFSTLASWELPLGRGKLIGGEAHGFLNALLSGWVVGANMTLQTGFPIAYPNAPQIGQGSAQLSGDERSLYRAFDTNLFPTTAPNLSFTYRTWPTRFSDVRTYPLRTMDASMMKRTKLFERLTLEIRAEMYNAFNTPWFSELDANAGDVSRNRPGQEFGRYDLSSSNSSRVVALVGRLIW